MVEIKEENGKRLAYLSGEMTIYNAKMFKDELTKIVEELPQQIVLDLSQVSEIDTSGLQLLLMTRRKAAQKNKALQLVALSTAVIDAISLYNLNMLNENLEAANGG